MKVEMRTDNRYRGRLTVNGKRKEFYGTTKAEVRNKAKEYLMKIENGFREPEKMTFNDFAEYWLKTYKKGEIEPSSYTRLYRVFDSQLRNTIGKKLIGDITEADIRNLINEYANPTSKDTTPLALSGLKKILQFLRPCFKCAIKEGIIYKNPCDDIKLPKESTIKKKTKEQFSLSDDELNKFRIAALEKCKTTGEYRSRNALVLLLLVNLGLRAGEALALEWNDVDFDQRTVRINKTLQCGVKNQSENGNAYVSCIKDSTKTKAGVRTLPFNENVLFYFNELKAYDERNGIISPYVCCNNWGNINNHRNLQKCLNRLIKNIETDKQVTLHTLRHTFGSTLLRHGYPIEVVSKLMGHANITITYNKYIHVLQEEAVKLMNALNVC